MPLWEFKDIIKNCEIMNSQAITVDRFVTSHIAFNIQRHFNSSCRCFLSDDLDSWLRKDNYTNETLFL